MEQLEAIEHLPVGDPMDPYYKRVAAEALTELKNGKTDDARDRLRKG
jgi:hypothetical protein